MTTTTVIGSASVAGTFPAKNKMEAIAYCEIKLA